MVTGSVLHEQRLRHAILAAFTGLPSLTPAVHPAPTPCEKSPVHPAPNKRRFTHLPDAPGSALVRHHSTANTMDPTADTQGPRGHNCDEIASPCILYVLCAMTQAKPPRRACNKPQRHRGHGEEKRDITFSVAISVCPVPQVERDVFRRLCGFQGRAGRPGLQTVIAGQAGPGERHRYHRPDFTGGLCALPASNTTKHHERLLHNHGHTEFAGKEMRKTP